MLDKQSRKILKYIRNKGSATFNEIVEQSKNQSLTAYTLIKLNINLYIIRVEEEADGKKQAIYELQDKGYAELEEYKKNIFLAVSPIIISIFSLIISIISLLMK